MQTTDLIGTGIALLGTRLLAEGPLLLTRAHDEAIQLNLSGGSEELLSVPFFPHPENPLTFSGFLEEMAKKGASALRMISVMTEDASDIPARIREGFQGTSHLMLAVQIPGHVLAYKAYVHQEVSTDVDYEASRQVESDPAFPFVFEGGFTGEIDSTPIQDTLPAYRESLEELILWCGFEGLEAWQHRFALALQDLTLDDPEAVHPVFQLVKDYCPEEVSRFFRSASRAWAFGGLNSWNDLPHTGTERYEELTENLLLGIKGAILTTANWEFEYSPWC